MKNLKPYLIFGIVVTVIAIFVIPFFDTLSSPGTTYAEGLRSVFTYLFAAVFGFCFAFFLYRSDQRKKK